MNQVTQFFKDVWFEIQNPELWRTTLMLTTIYVAVCVGVWVGLALA